MATYQQDDDHDRITHVDMLNLLRQDMREGFAQQREVINARFDALESKVAAVDDKVDRVDAKVDRVDDKVERHFAEHTAQANESKTGRRWLVGIAIGVSIAAAGFVGQLPACGGYLPTLVRALQTGS